jgi:GT2 family glycosyltransferase
MGCEFTFIIPTWNQSGLLETCLKSVTPILDADCEVIVFDNGSTDCTNEVLSRFPGVVTLGSTSNLGFAVAVNRSIEKSRGKFIVLLNNDVELKEGWLAAVRNAIARNPRKTFFATLLLQAHAPHLVDTAGFDISIAGGIEAWAGVPYSESVNRIPDRPFGAVGAAAVYPREALDEVGFLEEMFFAYGEDTDLSCRLRARDYQCVLVRDAVGLHLGSATAGNLSDFKVFLTRRNVSLLLMLTFGRHLLARALVPHVARELVAFAYFIVKGRGRAVVRAKLDFFRLASFAKQRRKTRSRDNLMLKNLRF